MQILSEMHAYEAELALSQTARAASPRERSAESRTPVQAVLELQRLAGNESVGALLEEEEPSPVREVVGSGGGAPMPPATRAFMEERLGHDFSDVRIHTGPKADESASTINAQAYTVGTDVVFRSDRYAPETDAGRRVLAHELTHVVQQKAGPVAGTPTPGGIRLSDPSDPFEQAAERAADVALAQPAPVQALAAPESATVQRQEDEEDEEVQALAVQRQDEEEEEEPA